MPSDKEILKAELEDGYGRVANLLLEALSISKLNGKQMSICLFIIRRTYSWGKKSDEITLKEFALACDSSETYMSKQLKQLIKWKVVIRKNYSPGKVPEYEINTRVDGWDKGCLNVQGLNENIVNNLYTATNLEQIDKGCTKGQGLNESTRQPLNNQTRVVQGQSIDNTGVGGPLKESSKESTTTTSITGTLKVERESSVADIDADSIQQDDKKELDLRKIEDYYKREIRGKAVCSGTDLKNISDIYGKYKDVDFIISVMEKAKEDYLARYGTLAINSFSYFDSIFEERWQLLHAKKEDKKVQQPVNRNYSFNKAKKTNKTKFHNFEGRSEQYSADEINKRVEDIEKRKRREARERMKQEGVI